MRIEFAQHVLDELADLKREVIFSAARMKYGTYSERHPFAGKMIRCPHCRQRRRENAVLPCCSAKLVKSPKPVLDKSTSPAIAKVTGKQQYGAAIVAGLPKHRNLSSRKNRVRFFSRLFTMPPFGSPVSDIGLIARNTFVSIMHLAGLPFGLRKFVPAPRLGKTTMADGAALAEEYVKFQDEQEAKRIRRQQRRSRRINRA